jgi:SAM-dependent methyltransferase
MRLDAGPEGYVEDIEYPEKYFQELSPVWLNYVASLHGYPPVPLERRFEYLELGCGPATSSLIHAAAFPDASFWACDFNRDFIAAAIRRAESLDVDNVQLIAKSFEALDLDDLPLFDFIVLHGVYSWVSADVRDVLLRIIRRSLRPDGIVYVSYNCQPGWAPEEPLRRLMLELADIRADSRSRVEHAQRTLGKLRGTTRYESANPSVGSAIDAYLKSDPAYLAHEFFNESWHPSYSIDVEDEMASIGLAFVGSATLTDNFVELQLSSEAAVAIEKLETARQRKLATDFAVNRQFRRDIFVKGARVDSAEIDWHSLDDTAIALVDGKLVPGQGVAVPRGNLSFQADFVSELLQTLSSGSLTMRELIGRLGTYSPRKVDIARNLGYLTAAGALRPAARFHRAAGGGELVFSSPTAEAWLEEIVAKGESAYVPSSVLGGGIEVSPEEAAAAIEAVSPSPQRRPPRHHARDLARLERAGVLARN